MDATACAWVDTGNGWTLDSCPISEFRSSASGIGTAPPKALLMMPKMITRSMSKSVVMTRLALPIDLRFKAVSIADVVPDWDDFMATNQSSLVGMIS